MSTLGWLFFGLSRWDALHLFVSIGREVWWGLTQHLFTIDPCHQFYRSLEHLFLSKLWVWRQSLEVWPARNFEFSWALACYRWNLIEWYCLTIAPQSLNHSYSSSSSHSAGSFPSHYFSSFFCFFEMRHLVIYPQFSSLFCPWRTWYPPPSH